MNKTILITGSTDGIGKLAALKLAKDGHHIYLHGRSQDKLNRVIQEIKTNTGNENVGGFTANFSDMTAVKNMATEVKGKLSKMDILINNAGIFKSDYPITAEGLDIRIVVNYYAPYLMTHELLPLIKAGTEPRIINLSSAAQSPVTQDFLSGKSTPGDNEAYAQSKLAILLWSFHLAKTEPSISTVALNPGSLLNTNMVREAYGRFWSPAEKGGDIIYELTQNDLHPDASGKYFDNDKGTYGLAHPDAYNPDIINSVISNTKSVLERL